MTVSIVALFESQRVQILQALPHSTTFLHPMAPPERKIPEAHQPVQHARSWRTELKEDCWGASLEFVGTFFFLLLAFGGVQAANDTMTSSSDQKMVLVLYASFCFGFSLLVSAWLFFRVTGGLFNPNVSLALMLVGVIKPLRFLLYSIAQLAGAIAAAAVVLALTPGPCSFNTSLSPGMNKAQGLFMEMFVTAFLVLTVLMLAVEKHMATPFAPVGIGLSLFVCELWSINYTGGAVNTARAFGPAVVTGFPYNGHWIYWLGPILGSLLGTVFYAILKHYKYWELNPGQESTNHRDAPRDPIKLARERTMSFSMRANSDHREHAEDEASKRKSEKTAQSSAV